MAREEKGDWDERQGVNSEKGTVKFCGGFHRSGHSEGEVESLARERASRTSYRQNGT